MIIGFTGTPGSGKTYEAVKKILDNLSMGRIVYTNIDGIENPICREMIKNYCNISDLALETQLKILEKDQIPEFFDHIPPGALVVIDEIQNEFNSRDWQSEKNKEIGKWATTHRHHGFDLVLILPQVERVDAIVRDVIQWTYVFRKVDFFGGFVQKKYICYAYAGNDATGNPLTKKVRTYNDKIFRCYKSYVSDDIKEIGIMKHVNILKHPVFFILPVVIAVTIYMLFFKSSIGTGDIFGHMKASKSLESRVNPKEKGFRKSVRKVDGEETHRPLTKRYTNNRIIFSNRTGNENFNN